MEVNARTNNILHSYSKRVKVNVQYCKKPIIFQLKLYFILSLANSKLLDDVENIWFNIKKVKKKELSCEL